MEAVSQPNWKTLAIRLANAVDRGDDQAAIRIALVVLRRDEGHPATALETQVCKRCGRSCTTCVGGMCLTCVGPGYAP